MHILFVAPRFHTNLFETIQGLQNRGHHVSFFVFSQESTEDHSLLDPTRLPESAFSKIERVWHTLRKQRPLTEKEKIKSYIPCIGYVILKLAVHRPDIVIVRDENRVSVTVCLACKLMNIKTVVKYSQVPLYERVSAPKVSGLPKIARPIPQVSTMKNSILPRISYTPVETRTALDFLQNQDNYRKKKNKYFIPLIAKAAKADVTSRAYCADGKLRVIDIGKFRAYKNHELYIDAIALLPEEKFEFSIIGQCSTPEEEEYFRHLESYIASKNLTSRIHLIRNIPFAEIDDVYLHSDVLVLASLNETAAVCILEAMSHGVIPISPDTNGTATYIENGTSGFIYSAGNAAEIAEKLTRLAQSSDFVREMGKHAFTRYCNSFSFTSFYENFKKMLSNEFKIELP